MIGLGAIFESGLPPGEALPGILFMPFGVVVGLILAWKWEGLGGIITLISVIGFHLFIYLQYGNPVSRIFPFLPAIPALLFIIYWYFTKIKN